MGRNFDWQDCLCIISKVTPKDGYKYISSFNPHFFGFGDDWKPEGFTNQYLALSVLFVALDGINEKGLAVADLMAGEGEIIGGSQREDNYDVLLKKMEECGLKPEEYEFYTDLRKWGSNRHSGFGLGFERIIMYITGIGNIRDVLPFPRTVGNCDL